MKNLFMTFRAAFAVFCALLLAHAAGAHGFKLGELAIAHPYANPTIAAAKNGAAYLTAITNSGDKPDRLLSASSSAAGKIELHEMTTINNMMRMREVPFIEIPAHGEIKMGPGQAFHLMLIDLKKPLNVGDRFEVMLNFEKAGKVAVTVVVDTLKPKLESGHEEAHAH